MVIVLLPPRGARGFGRSPAPAVSFSRVRDLRAVLDHTGVKNAVIAGHSGGGGTVLSLALSDPERIASLILVAPGLPDYPWPPDDPYVREFAHRYAAATAMPWSASGLAT